ncbi:family 1 encapsulin nanocompartment shell protein [Thermoproteus tenax]|uniref:Rubrerythrin diiron-binding domain-containing protein n=1 Tax=Thermoproteus tenax (strain ATCC 35583 / DSM 2078 / JCM 9277 / NBRC 100435 / Kra 1) TaxID=768679 RepID=G4RNJ8_THETK|nr:family 1 encapsulin nanocompartment shell protein [Thermoproteus tenax]CCC81142.1 conserved hypothetical protein [Thermoproteus tenax Kra 1]
MFSKNPVEIVRDKKLSSAEVADALRLAMAAEIDAINLYLQLARLIDDEKIRGVFEDVAREEKTHLGEFLEALKRLDPTQAEELEAGAREVAQQAGEGSRDPPQGPSALSEEDIRLITERVRQRAASLRKLRRVFSIFSAGPEADVVPLEETAPGDVFTAKRRQIPLTEISVKFSISQRQIDYSRRQGQPLYSATADAAVLKLVELEESHLLNSLTSDDRIGRMALSQWSSPGEALGDVAKAAAQLIKGYIPEPYVLLVGPERYAKLLTISERAGLTELERVKGIVREVVVLPQLREEAVVASADPSVVDVAVGADTSLSFLGPSDGEHLFRLWETIALRIKNPQGVVLLK